MVKWINAHSPESALFAKNTILPLALKELGEMVKLYMLEELTWCDKPIIPFLHLTILQQTT